MALDGVSLRVPDGHVVALVGLNGAGKTTLIRIGCGALLPTAGDVFIDGMSLSGQKAEASARLGWVPEQVVLSPRTRLAPYLLYLGRFSAATPPIDRSACERALNQVGLGGMGRRTVSSLSLGMLRRYSVAAALLTNPSNLLFDEVLNGLDSDGIGFFRSFVDGCRRLGRSVLISSHSLIEMEMLADDIAVIHAGRLKRVLPMSDVKADRSSPILIVVQGADDGALAFLSRFGTVSSRGDRIRISDPSASLGEIARASAEHGLELAEIRRERTSIEALLRESGD